MDPINMRHSHWGAVTLTAGEEESAWHPLVPTGRWLLTPVAPLGLQHGFSYLDLGAFPFTAHPLPSPG